MFNIDYRNIINEMFEYIYKYGNCIIKYGNNIVNVFINEEEKNKY